MQQKESGRVWQILAGRARPHHPETTRSLRLLKRIVMGKRIQGKGTMVQFSRMRSFFVLLVLGLGPAVLLACADRPTSGPYDLIIRGGGL